MAKVAKEKDIKDYLDFEYDDENKTAKIIGHDEGIDALCTDMEIPDVVTHSRKKYKVTAIGDRAFINCKSMKTAKIPDGVESIGDRAFCSCTSMRSVKIPKSVKSIAGYAFYNCTSLKSLTFPDGIDSVGEHIFSGCTSLAKLSLPDTIKTFGGMAFFECTKLKTMEIPEGVKEIKYNAFAYCKFDTMYFPKTIEKFDQTAFLGGSRFYDEKGETEIKDYMKLVGHRFVGAEDSEGRWKYTQVE